MDSQYKKNKRKKPYTTNISWACMCEDCCSDYINHIKTRDVFINRVYNRNNDWILHLYYDRNFTKSFNKNRFVA